MTAASDWRTTESPTLRIPMELREVDRPDGGGRLFEVQELRNGSMFMATVPRDAVAGRPDAVVDGAVCIAVEKALLEPPDKEPGETYEVAVSGEDLEESSALLS